MNELYPIIRRLRRPLVPLVEGAAGGAGAKPAESAKAEEEGTVKTGADRDQGKDAKDGVKRGEK